MAELAVAEVTKTKLEQMKDTLQNEVLAEEELERLQGVKRKQQQKHTQPDQQVEHGLQ